MKENAIINKLASRAMDSARRRGWGLGDVVYDLNRWAFDELELDGCGAWDYDDKDNECKGNHTAHKREARKLASKAYERACDLEDMGVASFQV